MSIPLLKQTIIERHLTVEVFTGTRDPLIDPQRVTVTFQALPSARVHLLDETHLLLSEKLGAMIRNCWSDREK